MDLRTAITKRVNDLLKQSNTTRYAISKKILVSQQILKYVVEGKSGDLGVFTVAQIASGFGLTLAQFFDDEIFENVI